MTRRILAVLLAGTVLSGCYLSKPLETVPAPRTHISAQLSDTGAVVLGNALGAGVVAIEGVVESADQNEWKLHMVSTDLKDGRSVLWSNELVTVPAHVLIDPTMRVLDKRKSWLTAGAILAGTVLAARAFKLIGGTDEKQTTPTPQGGFIPGGGK